MRIKSLALAFASIALLASCGGAEKPASSSAAPTTTSEEVVSVSYLGFVAEGKVRFSVPEAISVTFSYGTQSVADKAVFDIASSAKVSAGSATDKNYSFVVVTLDKADKEAVSVNQAITGDHLTEYNETILSSLISGAKKAFVAIAEGDTPKWEKGLNERMDAAISAFLVD